MKPIFALLLLLPFVAPAQECNIKKSIDPYTKEARLSTGFMALNNSTSKILLSIDATKTDIDFFFSLTGTKEGKCFDDASTATVMYEGGRLKSNFKNSGTMNCDGLFHITFRNSATTPSNLQNLSIKKIITIRLTGNNKTVTDITLTPQDQKLLMEAATCMIREAKTLLK